MPGIGYELGMVEALICEDEPRTMNDALSRDDAKLWNHAVDLTVD